MRRESSSSQNRKAGHTLTHSHTGRLLYPRYSPAAARVTILKIFKKNNNVVRNEEEHLKLRMCQLF